MRHHRIASARFDKGFRSPANWHGITAVRPQLVLPTKGKRSPGRRPPVPESTLRWCRNAAAEPAINALEVPWRDRCPDHVLEGVER